MSKFEKLGLVRDYTSIEGAKVKTVVAQFKSDVNGYRLKFDHDPTLTNSRLLAIEVVNTTTGSLNPQKTSSSGDFIPNLTTSELSNMVFVLAKGDEQIFVLPCVNMIREQNSGKPVFVDSIDHVWGDSYIELVASGIVTANYSVITVNVWYSERD